MITTQDDAADAEVWHGCGCMPYVCVDNLWRLHDQVVQMTCGCLGTAQRGSESLSFSSVVGIRRLDRVALNPGV